MQWLDKKDPTIILNEINGKHSEVISKWSKLCYHKSVDYYEIEEYGNCLPDCLEEFYEQWKEECGADKSEETSDETEESTSNDDTEFPTKRLRIDDD